MHFVITLKNDFIYVTEILVTQYSSLGITKLAWAKPVG